MDEVAASQDKYAFAPQRGQPLRQLVVVLERLRVPVVERVVEAQLEDRDVRVGIHMVEYRPGRVVQAPFLVAGRGLESKVFPRQPRVFWRSGTRITHLVQLARKAVEIVYGARFAHAADKRSVCQPVCGDDHYRLRRRQFRGQRGEAPREIVVGDYVHGRTVPDEEYGHFFAVSWCFGHMLSVYSLSRSISTSGKAGGFPRPNPTE